jgi:tetratricopeptide (TPR) repeat protein
MAGSSGGAPVGTLQTALDHCRALLERDPTLAEEQAGEILRAIPDQPQALTLRGRALAARGQTREAIAALRHAARRDPESPDMWRTLGDQLTIAGDHGAADQAYAHQIRTSVHDPRLRHAAVALCDNNLPVAERTLKDHLKQHPTDVAAIRMLAELAGRIGRNADAEALLTRAMELAPGFTTARFNLATLLYRIGRIPEALDHLDRLMADDPDNSAARNLAAAALGRIGDVHEAIRHYEHVLARDPAAPKVWMSFGHALKTAGRQADSVDAYRRCIALEPGSGEAWWSLANLKTVRFAADDIGAMEGALAADDKLSVDDRLHLHFALGKALEDAGADEQAFAHYARGNALRLEATPYDADDTSARVDRTIALFTPEFVAAHTGQGCDAADPIFILGMPRAGSTLTEQILASHPQVEGTQELPDIQMMASRLAGRDEDSYPGVLATLSPDRLRELGESFLESTRIHRREGRPFFIDKMPNNWLHAGLIHLILPNARIIDARRHPLGCCFSNYKQHFARGQAFSYSLSDMGRYYADYVRLMDHFDRVMPGRIHRLHYEAMVDDTEVQVRALLDHLGLPFDPACLRHHENQRAVRTASSEQVRQPIYRDGVDHWQRFDRWLDPLRAALGPVTADYPHKQGG